MFAKRFLIAMAFGAGCWFFANDVQAQSYFYGYYYPDEHRFNSPMLNTGVLNYTTVTPMWNAANDYKYGNPSRLYSVPTTSPLPTTSPFPSQQRLSMNQAAPANIRVVLPDAAASVWFEGNSTKTTGTDRVYLSPPIALGNSYSYHVKAAWTEGGRQVVREQTILVGSGQTAVLDFTQTLNAKK